MPLLVAQHCAGHVHLVLGSNALAAARCAQSLAAGAAPPVIIAGAEVPSPAVQRRIEAGEVRREAGPLEEAHLLNLGRPETGRVVDAVFITDASAHDAPLVASLCRRHRIPINVVDAPDLCTFSLLSVHADGPLLVGVTTGGRGCRLASRIRRDVAAGLPVGLGAACDRLGELRRRIREEDQGRAAAAAATAAAARHGGGDQAEAEGEDDDSLGQAATFNRLVVGTSATEKDETFRKSRRARWLAQVCEYWPLSRLAGITDADVDALFATYPPSPSPPPSPAASSKSPPKLGRLILAGTGPGDPSLLTLAAHRAILGADVVLADKLVPSAIMDLIPRRTAVHIARKFPGNADPAQAELFDLALAAVREGKRVVRLKQGDPFVYGRGGEEVAFFDAQGLRDRVTVLPGLSSALAAPAAAGIPVTQRAVADQVVICTGTGTGGKKGSVPAWEPGRTVVFLMALNRIVDLVEDLTGGAGAGAGERLLSHPWPRDTACAVVERATCPDQRVIRTTLEHVAAAIETEGSRPPGLLVMGPACEVLHKRAEGKAWAVEEGFEGFGVDR